MLKNWKTTLGGIMLTVGIALTASNNTTTHLIGVILSAAGALLGGSTAADAK